MSREGILHSASADSGEAGGLRFFGAITASVSHELNNVLTIIDQVGGLLQDLLGAAQAGAPIRTEQLKTIQERVLRQTQRGVEIIRDLNRFAHGVDDTFMKFDLDTVVGNLAKLAQRPFDLGKARLVFNPSGNEISVSASPFRLQQVIFQCLRAFLDHGIPGKEVALSVASEGSWGCVEISGPNLPTQTDWSTRMGGVPVLPEPSAWVADAVSGPEQTVIRLRLPAR